MHYCPPQNRDGHCLRVLPSLTANFVVAICLDNPVDRRFFCFYFDAARFPLGDPILLRRHVRARAGATLAMGWVTDGLLHLFAHPQPLARELRNRGMGLLNQLAPIKRFLTQRALDA